HGVVRATMHAEGIDVERALASKALVLTAKEQSYLKQGVFNTEWMSIFWKEATELAMTEGFSALRATGEADWILRDGTGLDHWWEYESKLTDMLSENNCFVLCQYNRRHFPPRFILDVIRTHPVVVDGGAPLSDVLNDICSAIDEQSTGAVSTVLLMDPDGQHLRPIAGPRLPGGWRQAMTPVEIGPKVASCGAAAFRKEPVVVSDIAS